MLKHLPLAALSFFTFTPHLPLATQPALSSGLSQTTTLTTSTRDLCTTSSHLQPGTLIGGAKIRWTEWHDAGSTFLGDTKEPVYNAPQADLPAYCRVVAEIETSEQSTVRFEVWFPETEVWGERLLVSGNSGWAGGVNYPDVAKGLRLGFASVGTDGGHNSSMADGTWLGNQEQWIDFAHRAVHLSSSAAKEITAVFYGKPARFNYIYGCSTGGRMGINSAQMYPEDFDGILSGCPVLHHSHLESWEVWMGQYNYPPNAHEGYISSEVWKWVHEEALRQCDALDGLTDGLVSNPMACDFTLAPLLCNPPSKTTQCLTPAQLTNIQNAYTGWVTSSGEVIYDGMEPGGELMGIDLYFNLPFRGGYGNHFFRYGVLRNEDWDFDITVADVRRALAFDVGDAWSADLRAFRDRGGKILHYHGLQDSICTSRTSIRYYQRVREFMQSQGVYQTVEEQREWYRLFLVPGLGHCSNGDGAWVVGTANQALPSVKGYLGSALEVLVDWVERGRAPEKLIGVKYKEDQVEKGVAFTRPTCAYPAMAKLVGKDVNDEKSWVCDTEGHKEAVTDRKWVHDEI